METAVLKRTFTVDEFHRMAEWLVRRVQEGTIVSVQDPIVLSGHTELYPDLARPLEP